MVVQKALYLFNETTLPDDKTDIFDTFYEGGLKWLDSYKDSFDPEAFTMATVDTLTMVKYMQGDVFKLPTTSNKPDDIIFDLPPPATTVPLAVNLTYLPILDMAALIKARLVSCVSVVQHFISRLAEFEPFLAIVSLFLTEKALKKAAEYDKMIAEGTYLGPMMCIPFGMKDHHQIDDEVTADGHILYGARVKPIKSSLMKALMEQGAIPIAKMQMGAWANGPVHGWGQCMSPYLTGNGGGSSCGSGSGAALGALPFAISEETWGSIVSPCRENHISGHLTSYGVFSRGGASILSPTMDHFGFHSRWVKDYGVILNAGRTGADPNDADSTAFEFVDPAKVDVSKLKVLIVTGDGKAEYDNATGKWVWNDKIPLGRKLGWHWKARMEKVMEALDAASIPYDSVDFSDSLAMWSHLNDSTVAAWPYDDTGVNRFSTSYYAMYSQTSWAKIQQFFLGHENSNRRNRWGARTIPLKLGRNIAWHMTHMGKLFFNDPLWKIYDVVITADAYSVSQKMHSSFEQWVRTAKTFLVDYYQETPCLMPGAKEGAFMTLTALPFKDYLNFAVGTAIQEYAPIKASILYPDEAAIKTAFEGRERCPKSFYAKMYTDPSACPAPNEPGFPFYGLGSTPYASMNRGCTINGSSQHLPTDWANSPYISKTAMSNTIPDEAIYRWETYGPVACTHVCTWVPSLCEYKGITCDRRRLTAEAAYIAKNPGVVPKNLQSDARHFTKDELRKMEEELMEDV